jgi:hypothetical protein
MKKNVIYLLCLTTLFFMGCEEEFLDKDPQGDFITQSQLSDAAALNPGLIDGTLQGVYSTMISTQTGGTTGHDDFGHKAYDLFSDFLSSDMALSVSTYGWYRASITEMQCTEDFTFADNRQVWQHYYTIIRAANTVIATLGGNDAEPELDANKHILGQALALRAHSYFYLTQYFSNDYDPSAEILPLYLEATNIGQAKEATSVIYAQMESDLNRAIDLLSTFNRPSKSAVNAPVAKAILAYVIASTRDTSRLPEVVSLCNDVIAESGASVMSSSEVLGGFNNVSTPGWIWGFDLTNEIGLNLVSWWGQVDAFSYSYAWAGDYKVIDQSLFDAIPANDVRKAQFFDSPANPRHLQPFFKFYSDQSNGNYGGAPQVTTSDYVFMRIAEMHLLKAESLAKMGQDGPARTALSDLLTQRLPDVTYLNSLSGEDLLDEIHLQTRIELWGEGKAYLAMKRNQRCVTRGSNHLSFVGETICPDEERFTFEIPEREIQFNVLINEQN